MRPEDRITEAARQVGCVLTDGAAVARLLRFLELLQLWNQRFHLTGDRDLETLISRHLADSLAVAAEVPASGHLIDIGSGAGFPGVVVACVRPDARVTLLESRRRPVSFLSEAARHVPLPWLRPILARAEDAEAHGLLDSADVVVSRAVRADVFLPLAAPLVGPGGVTIVMASGHSSLEPIEAAACAVGLERVSAQGYELAGGESRRLVRFKRVEASR